jgi:hypothetical protein
MLSVLQKMSERPGAIAARCQINRPASIFIQICAQPVVPPFYLQKWCLAAAQHN